MFGIIVQSMETLNAQRYGKLKKVNLALQSYMLQRYPQ